MKKGSGKGGTMLTRRIEEILGLYGWTPQVKWEKTGNALFGRSLAWVWEVDDQSL